MKEIIEMNMKSETAGSRRHDPTPDSAMLRHIGWIVLVCPIENIQRIKLHMMCQKRHSHQVKLRYNPIVLRLKNSLLLYDWVDLRYIYTTRTKLRPQKFTWGVTQKSWGNILPVEWQQTFQRIPKKQTTPHCYCRCWRYYHTSWYPTALDTSKDTK